VATGRAPATFLDGIVHEKTQREGRGFDLTLGAVHRVARPGRVDFGGGELEPAVTVPLDPERRDQDDDYGWWDLEAGQYLVEHNETLTAENVAFVLQPRDELVARGAFHPTVHVEELPRLPLSVGDGGVGLEENARVSTLLPESPK
jgi:hypothetical protein